MRICNYDCVNRYGNAKSYIVTEMYMEKWFNERDASIRRGNAYVELMDDFAYCYKNKHFCGRHKDGESLYKILYAWKEKCVDKEIDIFNGKEELINTIKTYEELPDLSFLEKITDINIFDPYQNSGDPTHQKWHLFIGVIAYSIMLDSTALDSAFKKWPCKVLRLWMIENSNIDQKVLDEIKNKIMMGSRKEVHRLIDEAFDMILEKDV